MALQRGPAPSDGLTGNVEGRVRLAWPVALSSRAREDSAALAYGNATRGSQPPAKYRRPPIETPRASCGDWWVVLQVVLRALRPSSSALEERARGIEPP